MVGRRKTYIVLIPRSHTAATTYDTYHQHSIQQKTLFNGHHDQAGHLLASAVDPQPGLAKAPRPALLRGQQEEDADKGNNGNNNVDDNTDKRKQPRSI